MKKIPTLFEREFADHKVVSIKPIVTPGLEWVLEGGGVATVKYDGACCAIIDGVLYKRYDAKRGKTPPAGAIPCQPEPDPITGHWPHWLRVDSDNSADKWFVKAYTRNLNIGLYTIGDILPNGTYEAVGEHFQGNPYHMLSDCLIPHGYMKISNFPRDFEGMKGYLKNANIEGVVFWLDGEPRCKIKRTDFGFSWPLDKSI